MENNNFSTQILDFFNLADVELMATFPNSKGEAIGLAVAKNIIATRTKTTKAGFTDLSQLTKIKGLGEEFVQSLLKRLSAQDKYPGLTKSQTILTYAYEAPDLSEFGGQVVLEKTDTVILNAEGKPEENQDQASYNLYYSPKLRKEQVLKRLESFPNYRSSSLARVFAIQTRNNQFVAASVPNYSVYLRDIYFANKFTIAMEANNLHFPAWFPTSLPNARKTVAIKTNFYGNEGLLSFNSAQNRVFPKQITAGTAATTQEYFDISGIIGEPWANAHQFFKSFTLMNFAQQNLYGADPREFIAGDNAANGLGSSNGLVGGNNQEGWRPEHQLRYVEIIENVAIENVVNPSHSGSNRWFINCVNSITAQVQAIGQSANAPIPASALFDMFVLYGYWEERGNIACRVAFRSKASNKFLGLKANSLGIMEDLTASLTSLDTSTSFYVENGWGGSVDNVVLKTAFGKYLRCWQDVVVADAVSAINNEQFKIVRP